MRNIVMSVVALSALAAAPAQAGSSFHLSIISAPPPVVYTPRPVVAYYAPAPIYASPRPLRYGHRYFARNRHPLRAHGYAVAWDDHCAGRGRR